MGFSFEWSPDKARQNLAKHGVAFEAMISAFDDPFALEWEDRRHGDFESRFVLLAQVGGRIYVVVYTWREPLIRMISARMAEPFERRLYYESNKK
jgi:uncharacterized DUF497 family protein